MDLFYLSCLDTLGFLNLRTQVFQYFWKFLKVILSLNTASSLLSPLGTTIRWILDYIPLPTLDVDFIFFYLYTAFWETFFKCLYKFSSQMCVLWFFIGLLNFSAQNFIFHFYNFTPFFFFFSFVFMRQGLTSQPRLSSKMWSSNLSLRSTRIIGICHHNQLNSSSSVLIFLSLIPLSYLQPSFIFLNELNYLGYVLYVQAL
jgi:hypothetical protein